MADLIISQPMTFTVDVKNGLVERPQRESLMRGDKMANRIIAELVYGSEPFDITGVTVKGKFCRPPNGDEIDLAGEAKGNVATVQLTDQCYTSGGHYEARVILVLGGVERTVLFISGDVLKSGSGNAAGDEETGGSGGSTGSGLPAGGTAGQVLVKVSSAQGDAIWKTLTAADVGARPDNWMPTAADVGALPSNGTAVNATQLNGKSADEYALKTDLPTKASDVGALAENAQAADASKLGGKEPKYYIQPRNLLDNSDFRNPVNQRGIAYGVTTDIGYKIDRWLYDMTGSGVDAYFGLVEKQYVSMKPSADGYADLIQNLEDYETMKGKTYTFALRAGYRGATQTMIVCFTMGSEGYGRNLTDDGSIKLFSVDGMNITIRLSGQTGTQDELVMWWAALYEGEYTADNLPPYVPKGYAAELAECQRYYYKLDSGNYLLFRIRNMHEINGYGAFEICPPIIFPQTMREKPTVEISYDISDGENAIGTPFDWNDKYCIMPNVNVPAGSWFDCNYVIASADL